MNEFDEIPFDRETTLATLEETFELPPESSAPAPTPTDPEQLQMTLYGTSLEKIAVLRERCSALTCDSPEGYRATKDMIGLLRTTRTRIEKRRKEHNSEHQDAIRFVNKVAKDLTAFIENLEDPLKEKKAAVDEAKERAKRAIEEAERATEEARLKAIHDAETERLRAESERLCAERMALEMDRRKLAADQLLISEAKARIAAKREAEEEAVREAERKAALAKRLEALRPDTDKVRGYAVVIRAIQAPPLVAGDEANTALCRALAALDDVATELEHFTPTGA